MTSRQGRPVPQDVRDRVVRLRAELGSARLVAERLGISTKLVERIVREARERGSAG